MIGLRNFLLLTLLFSSASIFADSPAGMIEEFGSFERFTHYKFSPDHSKIITSDKNGYIRVSQTNNQ